MTRVLTVMLILAVCVVAVSAADLSGYWNLELKPNFSGHDEMVACTVKQDGAALMLTCQGAEIAGSVDGQRVMFSFVTGAKRDQTATYSGSINEAGTSVTGTWHLIGPNVDSTGEFTMSKASEKALPRALNGVRASGRSRRHRVGLT
jgi:hypothetical protein